MSSSLCRERDKKCARARSTTSALLERGERAGHNGTRATLVNNVRTCIRNLCAGVAYLWKSRSDGLHWQHGGAVAISEYNGQPYHNSDGFFAEDWTHVRQDGSLIHWIRCGPPSTMYPIPDDARQTPVGDDQGDRTMVCESYGERACDEIEIESESEHYYLVSRQSLLN